ncbi:RNA-directed DNA polymerase, eukaryota, reverse transcriptase zinc-binding domain protein [Tanacetum coccineum]|uniref:RNA-directed DNA polymerase, eukaryota, reverse transcriptase zinc-binding domain protein n=1 Tax=Tanacetum coccineum TaxID=301880 RepID=A0ABQ5DYM4_9ASTR
MDINRRSSKRLQKIPSHFQDSVHDLNKKKGSNKVRASNMMNKEDDECLDQAGEECVEGNDIQDDVGEKKIGGSKESKGIVMDSEVISVQVEDVRIGVVGNDGKVSFGSVSEDMIKMYDRTSSDNGGKKTCRKSFVEAISQNLMECDKALESIPTKIDENGVEVVVFDDVMVAEGSKRWELTLCGFFVGYRMSINELRYNLRRMWSKFRFKDIVDCNNRVFFMKFHHEEGLNKVVNSGPWMVNEKTSVKGISALASRLGKPLVMDSITTNKCKQGIGMVRYARVLIEVSAKKILPNDVEIIFKNVKGMVQCRKTVKVEYDSKPPMCIECEVFGRTFSRCYKNVANITTNTKSVKENVKGNNAVNTEQKEANEQKEKNGVHVEDCDEGFVEVMRKKNIGIDNKVKRQNFRGNPQVNKGGNSKIVYQAKTKEVKSPKKTLTKMPKAAGENEKEKTRKNEELVDKGKKANIEVQNNEECKDVLEEISGVAKYFKIGTCNIRGLSTSDKQDEIVKLIQEEKLQICVVLKTYLKSKKIGKVCDRIFGRWNWLTNMSYCNKGYRIMVGWNDDMINISVVHMARQSMLVRVETRDGNLRLYGTFIASNNGVERKDLWEDIEE